MLRLSVLLLFGCLLLGCVSVSSPQTRNEYADSLAQSANWQRDMIQTANFPIRSYLSPIQHSGVIHIYIEGDGLAWISRTQPSSNPTPMDPLALKLALKEQTNAAYLARPCQYELSANCSQKYWTSARFSSEVVSSINQAVSYLKNKVHAKHVVLIGYSGGGAIATLVAARRSDVVKLITITGNLDPKKWAEIQGISPLTGSLNPAENWQQLLHIPQVHFVGGQDKIMPLAVAKSYQSYFPKDHKPEIRVIPDYDHHCCWIKSWPALMD